MILWWKFKLKIKKRLFTTQSPPQWWLVCWIFPRIFQHIREHDLRQFILFPPYGQCKQGQLSKNLNLYSANRNVNNCLIKRWIQQHIRGFSIAGQDWDNSFVDNSSEDLQSTHTSFLAHAKETKWNNWWIRFGLMKIFLFRSLLQQRIQALNSIAVCCSSRREKQNGRRIKFQGRSSSSSSRGTFDKNFNWIQSNNCKRKNDFNKLITYVQSSPPRHQGLTWPGNVTQLERETNGIELIGQKWNDEGMFLPIPDCYSGRESRWLVWFLSITSLLLSEWKFIKIVREQVHRKSNRLYYAVMIKLF